MWDEWGRLTRSLESVRLALARERLFLQSLMLKDPAQAKLRIVNGPTTYEVELVQHQDAVEDSGLLHAMALVHSYALAEDAAAATLGTDVATIGGIEVWSQRLLDGAGNGWECVKDGKPGVVEVAIVRNAVAHGKGAYDQTDVNRYAATGTGPQWKVGDQVRLDYDALKQYRSRLKSLLRCGKVE